MEPPVTTSLQIGDYALKREVLLDLTKLRDPFPKVRIMGDGAVAQESPADEKQGREVHSIPIPYWPDEREMTYEWTLHHREQNQKSGYDGALFSAKVDGEQHYFVYHLNSDDTGDVGTIGLLVNGKRPEQAADAQEFTERCVEWIHRVNAGEKVPIVNVGYSLGGAIAELVDRKDMPTILIDSPPVSAVQDKEKMPQAERDKNLLTIMGPHDGIYDAHGRHSGQMLVAGEKFWKTDHVSILDFWRLNEANHELSFLGKRLEKMPEWKTTPAAEWKRPTHLFDVLANYIEENTQGRELRWDEKLLQKQVKFLQGPGREATEKFAEFVFGLTARVLGAHQAESLTPQGFTARLHSERQGKREPATAMQSRAKEQPHGSYTARLNQQQAAPAEGHGL